MSGFYSDAQDLAANLLGEFGQSMVLRRVIDGAYNPATGTKQQTTSTFNVIGAVFDIEDARVNGTTVLRGDKSVTITPRGLNFTPVANADQLVIQGERHQIVSVKPLAPGGIVVTYELQVRKAA